MKPAKVSSLPFPPLYNLYSQSNTLEPSMLTTIAFKFCRSIRIWHLSLAFTISAILLSSHCFGQPVSITDFRIPTSSYQIFLGTLSGSWQKNVDHSGNAIQSSDKSDNTNLTTGLVYVRSELSEDRSLEINTTLNSNLHWFDGSNENPSGLYRSNSSEKSTNLDLTPSARYSTYFVPDKWFWLVEGQGHGSYYYDHNESSQSNFGVDNSQTSYSKNRNYQLSAGVGVGFGKMRDGESIFAALRVLDKLEEDGVLERPLTREEILRLVDHLAKQSEYMFSQDRYAKFLIRDIFDELEKMKILKTPGAYAYEVLRASEVLSESIEPRLFGWRLSAGILHGASESDQDGDQYSSVVKNSQDYLQIDGDYGYPVSLSTELTATMAVTIPDKDYQRRIGLTLGARASYQIGERIDASIGYTLNRLSYPRGTDDSENFMRELTHRIDLRFNFFIENDVSLSVTGGYSYDNQITYYSASQPWSNVNSSYSASIGLRYRFF
jgi:hypothetical protein